MDECVTQPLFVAFWAPASFCDERPVHLWQDQCRVVGDRVVDRHSGGQVRGDRRKVGPEAAFAVGQDAAGGQLTVVAQPGALLLRMPPESA